jgi:hypothetical protein
MADIRKEGHGLLLTYIVTVKETTVSIKTQTTNLLI